MAKLILVIKAISENLIYRDVFNLLHVFIINLLGFGKMTIRQLRWQLLSGLVIANPVVTFLLIAGLSCAATASFAQLRYKVLFLGNSYTQSNNMPQLLYDIALSAGDTLIYDSHTPGGYRLVDHFADSISRSKIMTGDWDYVVLQGQSQEPITNASQFSNGGQALYQLIKQYNPCAVVMPFMTWGRKNGDASNCASFPVMCTYEGMDTTLRDRYLQFTGLINGEVAPVSVVWRYLRLQHPGIDLYQPDESHPSVAGTYAAACCFYAGIFKKDPTLIGFNTTLDTGDAADIRMLAKSKVFDTLAQWNYKKLPMAEFGYQIGAGPNLVNFHPHHPGIRQNYLWDFGDGDTSSSMFPAHTYLADGSYVVTLTTSTCDLQGLHTSVADTLIQFCSHTPTIFTMQPWLCNFDTLWTQAADTFQWFSNGIPLPETNRYLANYAQYPDLAFSVLTTLNGCSELSELFPGIAPWTGYYFDAIGNPCLGDTVSFAVLHINGFLSGSESIFWLKNDTLLSAMTNQDTLIITNGGKYECRVNNPTALCAWDTTSYILEYDCSTTGVGEYDPGISTVIFPNPAEENITIRFTDGNSQKVIYLFDTMGRLLRSVPASGTHMNLNIADFSPGLYFIRQGNSHSPVAKFVKQ